MNIEKIKIKAQFLQDANTIQVTSNEKASSIHWYALHLYYRENEERICQALFTNYIDAERLKKYFEIEHTECKCVFERI